MIGEHWILGKQDVLLIKLGPMWTSFRGRYCNLIGDLSFFRSFPSGTVVKRPPAMQETSRRHRFDPWVEKIPWRRKWQPTPVFLPGKSHGHKSLAGYSPWGCRVRHNWACTQCNEKQALLGLQGQSPHLFITSLASCSTLPPPNVQGFLTILCQWALSLPPSIWSCLYFHVLVPLSWPIGPVTSFPFPWSYLRGVSCLISFLRRPCIDFALSTWRSQGEGWDQTKPHGEFWNCYRLEKDGASSVAQQ